MRGIDIKSLKKRENNKKDKEEISKNIKDHVSCRTNLNETQWKKKIYTKENMQAYNQRKFVNLISVRDTYTSYP